MYFQLCGPYLMDQNRNQLEIPCWRSNLNMICSTYTSLKSLIWDNLPKIWVIQAFRALNLSRKKLLIFRTNIIFFYFLSLIFAFYLAISQLGWPFKLIDSINNTFHLLLRRLQIKKFNWKIKFNLRFYWNQSCSNIPATILR